MKKLTTLVCALVLAVGCSKGDSKPESTAKTETPKPVEPAPAAPAPDKPVADKPVADKAPAKAGEATATDQQMVAAIEDRAQVEFMPEKDPKWIPAEVKTRVKSGKFVVDVLADGKVIDTIESGVEKGDIHMEARAKIGATKDGVVAVVSANKITGKPADSYMARVYTWNPATRSFEAGRKIEFEDNYDPAADGE